MKVVDASTGNGLESQNGFVVEQWKKLPERYRELAPGGGHAAPEGQQASRPKDDAEPPKGTSRTKAKNDEQPPKGAP